MYRQVGSFRVENPIVTNNSIYLGCGNSATCKLTVFYRHLYMQSSIKIAGYPVKMGVIQLYKLD